GTSARRGCAMSAAAGGRRRAAVAAAGDVDVSFAAHLAHVAVPLVLELALADRLAHLGAAVLVVDVGLAAGHALHDVPAGLGLEGRGDLAVLERGHLAAELGAEFVLREPAQVAALGLAHGVVGVLAGHVLEVGATGDARAQGVDPGLGITVAGGALGRAHQ